MLGFQVNEINARSQIFRYMDVHYPLINRCVFLQIGAYRTSLSVKQPDGYIAFRYCLSADIYQAGNRVGVYEYGGRVVV